MDFRANRQFETELWKCSRFSVKGPGESLPDSENILYYFDFFKFPRKKIRENPFAPPVQTVIYYKTDVLESLLGIFIEAEPCF